MTIAETDRNELNERIKQESSFVDKINTEQLPYKKLQKFQKKHMHDSMPTRVLLNITYVE